MCLKHFDMRIFRLTTIRDYESALIFVYAIKLVAFLGFSKTLDKCR